MRHRLGLFWMLALGGCGTNNGDEDDKPSVAPTVEPEPVCERSTRTLFIDETGETLYGFPDDLYLEDDPDSPTGKRVAIADRAWASDLVGPVRTPIDNLDGASGFGTTSDIIVRFDLPMVKPDVTATDQMVLVELSDQPRLLSYELQMRDNKRQFRVTPHQPLAPGTEHALVMMSGLKGDDDGCVRTGRAIDDDLAAALDAAGATGEPRNFQRFTTHLDHLVFEGLATDILGGTESWNGPASCANGSVYRTCTRTFTANDYRGGRSVTDDAIATYELEVAMWLPPAPMSEDTPVVLLSHGLEGNMQDFLTAPMAQLLVTEGFAVVGVDAVFHGQHPTGYRGGLPFLGVDYATFDLDFRAARSNIEQTMLDRLQLIRLLELDPDLSGNGDLADTSRLGNAAGSLGALLSPGVLRHADTVDSSLLLIAGGPMMTVLRDGEVFSFVLPILEGGLDREHDLDIFLSIAQSTLDPSDPAFWASQTVQHRTEPLDLVLAASIHDELIPAEASESFARAWQLPHLPPQLSEVPGLVVETSPGPWTDPVQTRGFLQLDQVTIAGSLRNAQHENVVYSDEAEYALVEFFRSWHDDGRATFAVPE